MRPGPVHPRLLPRAGSDPDRTPRRPTRTGHATPPLAPPRPTTTAPSPRTRYPRQRWQAVPSCLTPSFPYKTHLEHLLQLPRNPARNLPCCQLLILSLPVSTASPSDATPSSSLPLCWSRAWLRRWTLPPQAPPRANGASTPSPPCCEHPPGLPQPRVLPLVSSWQSPLPRRTWQHFERAPNCCQITAYPATCTIATNPQMDDQDYIPLGVCNRRSTVDLVHRFSHRKINRKSLLNY